MQIILGGASNTKTEIKQVSYQPGSVYETPNVLRRNEFVGFWIKFKFGTFDIGREDEVMYFPLWLGYSTNINYAVVCVDLLRSDSPSQSLN